MATSSIRTRHDAWTDEAATNQNHGDAGRLRVSATASNRRRSYLFFPRPFPLGAIVSEAKLRLRIASAADWVGSHTVSAERINQSWKEGGPSGITWSNAPTVTGTAATVVVSTPAEYQIIEIDVTAIMSSVASGGSWNGIRLTVDTSGSKSFYSGDANDPELHPELRVTFALIPDAPDSLEPSGDSQVAVLEPTFTWNAPDQSQFKLQISTSTDFTTPEFDTGWIATPEEQYDSAGSAWAGITGGQTRYWRVRYINADGLTSPWSETASFGRTNKGTLTITSPAGSTVDDTSPNITHTYTGQTQKAAQYIVEKWDAELGAYREIYDSGRTASTATSFTLPDGLIRKESLNYRLTLRVWDTIQRVGTPGDPNYSEQTKVFTYVRDGTPAAVTSLTLVGTLKDPFHRIEWFRSVRPDFFAIRVDNDYFERRVDPADVETSPGANTYRINLGYLRPNGQHTIEVEAVVLTTGRYINSDGNSTLNITPDIHNIWLINRELDIKVPIITDGKGPEMTIGEDGETFYPIGRRDPVRITSTVRGYEGSLRGSVAAYPSAGQDVYDYRDQLEKAKKFQDTKQFRLIWRDMNIMIMLGSMSIGLTYDEWFEVGFEFWQVDDYTFEVKL